MARLILGIVFTLLAGGVFLLAAAPADNGAGKTREDADSALQQGNFKDAYDIYRRLATAADDDPLHVTHDLRRGIECLQHLGRVDEADDFREKTISANSGNWRLL